MLEDLEELLALSPGALTSRLGPSRRPGPRRFRAEVTDVVAGEADLVEQALVELGLSGAAELGDEVVNVVVEVDAAGWARRVTITGVWRALVEGAQRLPLIYANAAPLTTMPEIVLVGARLGRDCSRLERGLVALEVLLDRPLSAGEEALVEQSTRWREEVTDTVYEHYLTEKQTDFTLWVRFDPHHLPATVERYTVVDDVETAHAVVLEPAASASLILHRFGPGRAGIRWTWPGATS